MADKRELILDLLARDKSGPGTRSMAKNLGDVGAAADKAGAKTGLFSRKAKEADDSAEDLGQQAGQTGRALERLADDISAAERELDRLARSFADTDDAAQRLDLSKAIRKAQNDLRRLTTAQKLIIPEPTAEQGQSWGRKFASSLGAGLKASGNLIATAAGTKPGITIGALLGAAAAPVLVSSMASAISAGVGGGAIGAAVMLAVKKDQGIQAAGAALGRKVNDGLTNSATKWFAVPIRQSLGLMDDAADRMVKQWDGAFKKLAPSLVPLVQDVVEGTERISGALANVAGESGPALDGLGDSFRLISDGAADFLEIVADGGPEAADNLRLIAGATADLARWTAGTLDLFNKISNNTWLTGPLLPLLRKHYKDAADASEELKNKTEELPPPMDNAARAARGERDALEGLAKEIQAQTDPVFGLLDAQDKLKKAHDDVAEAVKKHGRESREAKDATRRLAEAAVNLEGKAGALGKTFDGKMTPALKATLRAAGLTENEIEDVAAEFRRAKRDGDRFAKTYRAKVITEYISKYTTIVSSSAESAYERTKRQISGRATGGAMRADQPTWVGEHGPELVIMDRPARVLSASASRGGAGVIGSTATPRVTGLQLEVAGEREVVAFIRRLIRSANLLQEA